MTADVRRAQQEGILKNGDNIIIHENPLPYDLKSLDENSPGVQSVIKGGLTAYIYKLEHQGKYYCLKKKREEILVKNSDGQLSFLNEILCRKKIEDYRKNPIIDMGISKTHYANLREGVILTEWLEGEHPSYYNRQRFRSTFTLLNALEAIGLFEWDLCSGNLIFRQDQLVLFDFGYMYPMDPMKDLNSDGMSAKVFHGVERLETRAFMPYLLKHPEEKHLYRVLKEEAVRAYEDKLKGLEDHGRPDLVSFYEDLIKGWKKALVSDAALDQLFQMETMRSFALDIHDDLTGKTCTHQTLMAIDYMIDHLAIHYDRMKSEGLLLWFDQYEKDVLIEIYKGRRESAEKYLVGGRL